MQVDKQFYDLIIVGGGPAGLSAAIYMARAKYRVLVLEKAGFGGQITITSEVVNYPGVERTSGKDLTEKMRRQAEAFGAEFAVSEVLDMELTGDVKVFHTTKGEYRSLGVVLAVGANPRKLGFRGEKEFQGRGVAYCATCDGEFFTGRDVFVIGGGFAAVEEGIFLTKYARKVTLIVREETFTCAKTVSDQLADYDKIEVIFETELLEVGGDQALTHARFRNNRTGEEWTFDAKEEESFGVFVFAGYVPNTEWIGSEVEKDAQGYLITDNNQKTNLDGVYAAGDVCVKNLRQVVTAVADGAVAATSLEKVVSELHTKLGIPDLVVERATVSKADSTPQAAGQTGGTTDAEAGKVKPSGNVEHGFFSQELREQLAGIFAKFENPVLLRAWLDDSPLSGEITGFLRELEGMTDKVSWERAKEDSSAPERLLPSIEVCRADGKSSGIQFHAVPGGHEINSFVVALYNVAGPGQAIEQETRNQLAGLNKKVNLKVLVSLSCTMCPETVMSAQKAAAVSENVEAEMFDLAHFPQLREKYRVMSVPCMIINDDRVVFGKKNLEEVTEIIAEA